MGYPWDAIFKSSFTFFFSFFFLYLKRKTCLVFLFYKEAFNWCLGFFGGVYCFLFGFGFVFCGVLGGFFFGVFFVVVVVVLGLFFLFVWVFF